MMSEALLASNANLLVGGLRNPPKSFLKHQYSGKKKQSQQQQQQLLLLDPFFPFQFHSRNLARFFITSTTAAAATNRNSQTGSRSRGNSSTGSSGRDKDTYGKHGKHGGIYHDDDDHHYRRSFSSFSSSFGRKSREEAKKPEDHQRRTFGKQMSSELPNNHNNKNSKTFGNSSSAYGNSQGRYGDGNNVHHGSSSSNSYKSSKGGGGGGGGGRSRHNNRRRRYPEKGLPKGAYEMVDKETGENVLVWGFEDEELPMPTPADLKWEYTKTAVSGDVSDESWYKAMEASMGGASGAFSVKGVRQGGMYREEEEDDEDGDEDEDDDMDGDYNTDDEDDIDEPSEESESVDEFPKESQQQPTRVSRSPKVRVFGRDFGARLSDAAKAIRREPKAQDVEIRSDHEATKMSASGNGNSITVVNALSHDSAAVSVLPAAEEDVDQPWPPVGGLLMSGPFGPYSSGKSFEKASDTEDGETAEMESGSWPPKGILSHGGGGGGGYGLVENRSTIAGKENDRRMAAGPRSRVFDLGTISDTRANADDSSSVMEKLTTTNADDSFSVMENATTAIADDSLVMEKPKTANADDSSSVMEKLTTKTVVKTATTTTTTAQSRVSEQFGDDGWPGSMNPGIIEVTEGKETQGHRKRTDKKDQELSRDREPKSSFLDDLRIQTHRRLGSEPPPLESPKTTNPKPATTQERSSETLDESAGEEEESRPSRSKAHDGDDDGANTTEITGAAKPRSSMRDLNARSNFDPRLTDEYFSMKSFKDVGASEEVIKALASLQVTRPSAIQAMAFKPVLEGQSCIIADQTGSGKTLAYVAPLVQTLRDEEANGVAKALSKKPRVLVLVPTSELAVQVLNVCRAVSKGGAPFRSIVLTGGFKWKTQVESLAQGADLVVATPGRFLQHLQSATLQLDNLKCAVLDEVDILYDDEEFSEVLQTVERAASKRVQYVHVTATLPVDIHNSLLSRYPDSVPLMGPSLHCTAVGLQEILVDCSGAEGEEKTPEAAFVSKRTALLQLVDERPVSKTIVFCNKIETCRKVENAIARHDRNETKLVVLPYHAALSQQARLESMQQFLESKPKKNMFLVCTDRASRGLDSFDVEHVVLFDFPRDPSEYVRRVGRTARGAGGTGKVFVFALGKQVAMARRIMARNEKGHPVHSVPGSQYET